MDTKNLELIRNTALEHVQRCMSTGRLSTTCRYRRRRPPRGTPRNGGPCSREVRRFRRFVLEVTQGEKDGTMPKWDVRRATAAGIYALDLMQSAMDAALLDLQIERCTKRLAAYETLLAGEATEGNRPGRNRGLTQAKRPKGAETCLSPLSRSIFGGAEGAGRQYV